MPAVVYVIELTDSGVGREPGTLRPLTVKSIPFVCCLTQFAETGKYG